MNLIMFVFDPDGSFMMINGHIPSVHCPAASRNREAAMDEFITNNCIARSAADKWKYVCTGFDKTGIEYKVYKVNRLWPLPKHHNIKMCKAWPTDDPIFKGIVKLATLETK